MNLYKYTPTNLETMEATPIKRVEFDEIYKGAISYDSTKFTVSRTSAQETVQFNIKIGAGYCFNNIAVTESESEFSKLKTITFPKNINSYYNNQSLNSINVNTYSITLGTVSSYSDLTVYLSTSLTEDNSEYPFLAPISVGTYNSELLGNITSIGRAKIRLNVSTDTLSPSYQDLDKIVPDFIGKVVSPGFLISSHTEYSEKDFTTLKFKEAQYLEWSNNGVIENVNNIVKKIDFGGYAPALCILSNGPTIDKYLTIELATNHNGNTLFYDSPSIANGSKIEITLPENGVDLNGKNTNGIVNSKALVKGDPIVIGRLTYKVLKSLLTTQGLPMTIKLTTSANITGIQFFGDPYSTTISTKWKGQDISIPVAAKEVNITLSSKNISWVIDNYGQANAEIKFDKIPRNIYMKVLTSDLSSTKQLNVNADSSEVKTVNINGQKKTLPYNELLTDN